MRVRTLLLSSAMLLFPVLAQAQFGAYGIFQADRLSSVPYTSSAVSNAKGSFTPLGGTLGLYYDFHTFGPVRLGADLRGSILTSTKGVDPRSSGAGGRIDSGLAGIRAVFRTPFAPLRPYLQGSIGVARTNFGTDFYQQITPSNATSNPPGVTLSTALEYQALAGLDIKLLPALDIRLIELGIGGLSGSGTHSGTYPLESVGVGVVFHFPAE